MDARRLRRFFWLAAPGFASGLKPPKLQRLCSARCSDVTQSHRGSMVRSETLADSIPAASIYRYATHFSITHCVFTGHGLFSSRLEVGGCWSIPMLVGPSGAGSRTWPPRRWAWLLAPGDGKFASSGYRPAAKLMEAKEES